MSELATLYRIVDDCLSVISECPLMAGHIRRFLKSFETAEAERDAPVTRLAIFRSPGNRVMLCCPEVGMAEVEPLRREAWFRFRRLFAHLVINCGHDYYVLHASGIVARNSNAALIVGESNAGKTTLLAALLGKGYRFLCDDYAPIRFDDLSVISMPTGATLGERTFQLLPELTALKHKTCCFFTERQWHWTVNFSEKYPVVPANTSAKITHVFFVKSDFGQSSNIAPCLPGEAALRLIESRLQGPRNIDLYHQHAANNVAERRCALAQSISKTANFFTVVNGDLFQTVELITSVIGSP